MLRVLCAEHLSFCIFSTTSHSFRKAAKIISVVNKPPRTTGHLYVLLRKTCHALFSLMYKKTPFPYVGKGKRTLMDFYCISRIVSWLSAYISILPTSLWAPWVWDKDLVIFIFAILNTTSQSLPQPGRDLIVKIIYS